MPTAKDEYEALAKGSRRCHMSHNTRYCNELRIFGQSLTER